MELRIAVAKIDKYGTSKSGDTVEMIERPNGGISVVLADGQSNQVDNKTISTMVTHRVIGHLSEGVRDGAAIRATSRTIFTEHGGAVTANLNVLSADLQSNTVLLSRNNPVPVFLISEGKVDCLDADSEAIGTSPDITPTIVELPIRAGMTVILFTDGVYNAGLDNDQSMDICTTIGAMIEEQEPTPQEIADFLLRHAIRLDEGRPRDDMSVIVLSVSTRSSDRIRRMNLSMTLD
jgi:serine phosphatase RsbU (regulator of sigma subunit)